MNKRGRTKKPPVFKQDYKITFSKQIYSRYKSDSGRRGRGIKFNLLYEDFFKLLLSDCFYCGIKPSNVYKNGNKIYRGKVFLYSGIDRKDNSKGYTLSNVVPCCSRCNKIKSNLFTFEEMVALADFLRQLPQHLAPQQSEAAIEAQLATTLRKRIKALKES